jgi:hypothetical protein
MKKNILYVGLLILLRCHSLVYGQSQQPVVLDTATTLFMQNDTLVSNKGFSIFIGQKLVAGKGSDEKGRYKYVLFKSSLNWPSLMFRDLAFKNNDEYKYNPQDWESDQVLSFLSVGDTLTVNKIKQRGNKRKGIVFLVTLKSKRPLAPLFQCILPKALDAKEILIP